MSETPFDARALEQIDSPEATAAAYFSLFRSPHATERDYADFEHWHRRDEAHRRAWARVEQVWGGAGALRDEAPILAIREKALARRAQRRWRAPLALAAAVALAVGAGLVLQLKGGPAAPAGQLVSTGLGQQMTFRMTDGSTITANTASNLLVTETPGLRSTHLRQGEAFFEVARNPRRPFVVEADGVTVTALGTAFAVRESAAGVTVTLAHGSVAVAMPARGGAAAQTVRLAPGQQLVWHDGHFATAAVSVDQQLAWRQGMISFDRTPLAQAVAEINRYSPQEIVIASPAIAGRPITGSFRVGVARGFLQSLEAAGIARVEGETATRAELVAP